MPRSPQEGDLHLPNQDQLLDAIFCQRAIVRDFNAEVWRTVAAEIGRHAAPHKRFLELLHHVPCARTGGAANRPFSVALGYALAGGNLREFVLPMAAAVETANCTITYIFDKLIDDDPMVCGQTSLHRLFGSDLAVLAGEALEAVALKTIIRHYSGHARFPTLVDLYGDIVLECDFGQYLDVTLGKEKEGSISDAIRINDARTGQFVRRAAELGVHLAEGDAYTLTAVREAFHFYGRAVQDANDLLDVHPVLGAGRDRADVRLGKKTKPLVFALEMASPSDRKVLEDVIGNENASGAERDDASAIMDRCGAIERTRHDLDATIGMAIDSLDSLPESRPKHDAILYFESVRRFEQVKLMERTQ